MTICSECGTELDSDVAACPHCSMHRDAIADDRQCPVCRATVGVTDVFCASCGTSLNATLGEESGLTEGARSTGDREESDGGLVGIVQERDAAANSTWSLSVATLGSVALPPDNGNGEQADSLIAEEEPNVVASVAGEGDAIRETPAMSDIAVTEAVSAMPLPPVPDGGLNETMPTWLRTGPDPLRTIGQTISDEPVARKRDQPEKINPSQLISEDDLPEWIRQLVATEAAEKATADARQAAEADLRAASPRQPVDPPAAVSRQRSEPRMTVAEGSANPWLSRRDHRTGATHHGGGDEAPIGGRTSVFADMVESDGRRTPPPVGNDEPRGDSPMQSMPPMGETIDSPMSVQHGGPAANRATWLIWVAGVLLIVAIAGYALTSGAFR